MSHFAVLVVGSNPDDQLAPFQENNMEDCPRDYLVFCDEEDKYLKEYLEDSTEKVVMPNGRLLNPWDDKFAALFDSLPEDTLLTVVDCHI